MAKKKEYIGNKYYIIDYNYNLRLNKMVFFIHELIPNADFDYFVRDIEYPEIELLGFDSWDGIYPYYGVLLQYIKINKEQESLIRDLDIIKGYYINKEEAEKDLKKLIDFIEKSEKKYIF